MFEKKMPEDLLKRAQKDVEEAVNLHNYIGTSTFSRGVGLAAENLFRFMQIGRAHV